ncbi:MAG: hypothetical protein JSW28_04510, partial [Thermoplasmata archaeon]
QVIEHCAAKGPVEWDALNRERAKGVVEDAYVDGTTLVMNTRIGEGEVHFGPATRETGGQALKALRVKGSEVHTTWLGLAGASVGIGACLPQAPGVLRTEYKNLKGVGGANVVEVTVVSRKMNRLILGIDDTDSKEKGASWVLMLELMKSMPHAHPLQHKIIQLNPNVPEKTTSCVSIGASFAVEPRNMDGAIQYAMEFVKERTLSDHTSMAVYEGLRIPEEVRAYGLKAKDKIITIKEAVDAAQRHAISLIEITGSRGKIGALAAIGCFDMGLTAAGLPDDFIEES